MDTLNVFAYNGNKVTFLKGNTTMVNATQMAKGFGKNPKDWLKTKQSKDFIDTLSEVKNILSSDLLQVTYGDGGGTWMHEDVAMEFARWLSPTLAIWCNDRIKQLWLQGTVSIETSTFRGVPMVSANGRFGYYYRDVLRTLGYSPDSGSASCQKKRYPGEFFQLAGRNYCSPRMAELMGKRADMRKLQSEMVQELGFIEEEL